MQVGVQSPLRRLQNMNCPIDAHLNRGVCDVPTDYNSFGEVEIWEGMRVTSYSTTALASLSSDGRESTTESVDVSIDNAYRIYNIRYGIEAAPVQLGAGEPVVAAVCKGIVVAPVWCCGTNQCAITFVATSTHLYFVNRGDSTTITAYADATPSAETVAGIAMVGNRLAVALDDIGLDMRQFDRNGFTYTTRKTISGVGDIDAIASNGTFGVLSSGLKIYRFNATGTQIDESDCTTLAGGSATKWKALSVAPDGTCVAISDKGYTAYSTDGRVWQSGAVVAGAPATPIGSAICALSLETWIAGTTSGEVYLTSDHGISWTEVLNVTAQVYDIKMVTKHVVYMAVGAVLYRSVDGGATWSTEPNIQGAAFINMTTVRFLAPCPDDYNEIKLQGMVSNDMKVASGSPT
jgi:hypothetical protein